MKTYDFAVVGIGVTGAWTALELTRYRTSVVMIERENDVCMGATKANSAIVHAGYDAKNGTLMAKLNVEGNRKIRQLYKEMSIPFRQIGSLVLSFDDEGDEAVKKLYDRGINNGVDELSIISAEEVKKMEPNVSDEVRCALLAKTAGVVSPFELCIAAAEKAVDNGAEIEYNFDTVSVEQKDGCAVLKASDGREIRAKHVINCAGVHADDFASLFGDESFKVIPRRGEYCILDKNVNGICSHILFQPPVKYGKGILVSQTVDGNIIVGPTADSIEGKDDKATTEDGIARVFEGACKTIPSLNQRSVITLFSGVRPIGDRGDFIIEKSPVSPVLFNVAGIESPGLTAGPATGEYIAKIFADELGLETNGSFSYAREVIRFNELTDEEKDELIKKDPHYGRIICRCETISEGEIIDSIKRNVGARDVDGVKRRVRAGMGRCQGGFCGPKVIEILSRELGIPATEITKCGKDSFMVTEEM